MVAVEEKIPLLAALERADGATPNGSAPAWLARLREESAARFRETGLPTTRLEGWRRTSLAPMAEVPFGPVGHAAVTDLAVAPFLFGKFDAWRIVFVDGRFAPEHSSLDGLPAGVRVESLSAALAERPTLVEPHLGRIARWKDEPMVALNTAFVSEGAFVSLADRVVLDRPVHVAFLSTANGEPTAVQPRLLVVLGAAAELRLTEGWGGSAAAAPSPTPWRKSPSATGRPFSTTGSSRRGRGRPTSPTRRSGSAGTATTTRDRSRWGAPSSGTSCR